MIRFSDGLLIAVPWSNGARATNAASPFKAWVKIAKITQQQKRPSR
jgi:hypothetical protein